MGKKERKDEKNTTNETVSEETNNKTKKINFFKKIGYSIGKISKYDDLINLGIGKAIKYFLGLISMLSAIFAITVIIVSAISNSMDIYTAIYNIVIYFVTSFLMLGGIYIYYILLISLSIFLVIKIFKMEQRFSEAVSIAIYSSTLSAIIYAIYILIYLLYLYPNTISIGDFSIDLIVILVICIYVGIFFRKRRGNINNVFYRRNKKKSKK